MDREDMVEALVESIREWMNDEPLAKPPYSNIEKLCEACSTPPIEQSGLIGDLVPLLDELIAAESSRSFYGIGNALWAKLRTIRATALRSDTSRAEGYAQGVEDAGFDYVRPQGETFEEWREHVRCTKLYQRGDAVLVWVNEAELSPIHNLTKQGETK